MTDRELLELAKIAINDPDRFGECFGSITEYRDGRLNIWNPLTDDGDALRLATATGQAVFTGLPHEAPTYAISDHSREDFVADKDAAVRRAIVRAAAAQLKP